MSTGEVKLSPDKTWIPIGVALGGIASLVLGAVWVSNSFNELSYSNRELAGAVKRVETTLDRMSTDAVHVRQLLQWVEVLKAKNPTLVIPDLPIR